MSAGDEGKKLRDTAVPARPGRFRGASEVSDEHAAELVATTITDPSSLARSTAVPRAADPAVPEQTIVGDYALEALIGAGGGGSVYAARHRVHGQQVAIKMLREEMVSIPSMLKRFVFEATAVNMISHPNIVSIYEFGHLDRRRPYYVMELLDGVDLRKVLQQHGRFSPAEALTFLEPIADAVQAVHDAGFIHRDLKASNIFVTAEAGQRRIKLLDFGIAKLLQTESVEPGLTAPGTRLGTAHYMAPEQIRCERVDRRVDVYALGVLAYQLLTGEYPFQGTDPHQVAMLHLHSPVPRPSASAPVSPALDAVVLRCLEKDSEQRFPSVAEFVAAFRAAQQADGVGTADPWISGLALGVHVEVSALGSETHEDIFEDAGEWLDLAEQCLGERGFVFPLRTANVLLGARIAREPNATSAQDVSPASLLQDLRSELSRHGDPRVGAQIEVSFESGPVFYRHTPAGDEIVGGKLLDDVQLWSERYSL